MKKISLSIVFSIVLGVSLFAKEIFPVEKVLLNPGEHHLCGKSHDGKIELEDGTLFKALSSDIETVYKTWNYQDLIAFSHNPYPYPIKSSEFYIENITRGEVIRADFYSSSNPNDFQLKILHVDPAFGEIVFTKNGEVSGEWQVYEKDFSLLEHWETEDQVIIGKNNNLVENFGTNCPYILLNCDKKTHVRASQSLN